METEKDNLELLIKIQSTSTFKKYGDAYLRFRASKGNKLYEPKEAIPFNDLKEMFRIMSTTAPESVQKTSLNHAFSGIEYLERLSDALPAYSSEIQKAAANIVIASFIQHSTTTAEQLVTEAKKIRTKSSEMERAREIAKLLWQEDSNHEYKISDMVKEVENILSREGVKKLPNIERIREWIKPVAPVYAQKPGRPRKEN